VLSEIALTLVLVAQNDPLIKKEDKATMDDATRVIRKLTHFWGEIKKNNLDGKCWFDGSVRRSLMHLMLICLCSAVFQIHSSTPSKTGPPPCNDWSISSVTSDLSACNLHPRVGLPNVGNSCYLTSALQVRLMFKIPCGTCNCSYK